MTSRRSSWLQKKNLVHSSFILDCFCHTRKFHPSFLLSHFFPLYCPIISKLQMHVATIIKRKRVKTALSTTLTLPHANKVLWHETFSPRVLWHETFSPSCCCYRWWFKTKILSLQSLLLQSSVLVKTKIISFLPKSNVSYRLVFPHTKFHLIIFPFG